MKNGSKVITSSIRRKLSILLETLRKDQNFEIFLNPIDPLKDGCLDYFQVIKDPMDLSTVSKKLMDNEYDNTMKFHNDIMLIFSNCREYNTSPLCSHIITLCDNSEKRFILEWNKLDFVDKISKSDETECNNLNNKGTGSKQSNVGCKNIRLKANSDSKGSPSQNKTQTPGSITIRVEKPVSNKRLKGDESEVNANIASTPLKKKKEDGSVSGKGSNPNELREADSKVNDWKNECLRILNAIRKEDNSFLFENPVLESDDLSEETKNKYREVISEPCDYSTVEKRLFLKNNNKKRRVNFTGIDDPHEFERQIKLIFLNCMSFNPNTGDCKWIYDAAKQTLNKFNGIWNKSNVFKIYSDSLSDGEKKGICQIHLNTEKVGDPGIRVDTNFKNSSRKENDMKIGISSSITFDSKCTKSDNFKLNSSLSLNKIALEWNKYSILWRNSLKNAKLSGSDTDSTRKNGVSTRNSRKGNKSQLFVEESFISKNKSKSFVQGGSRGTGWRNRKKIVFGLPQVGIKRSFDDLENLKPTLHCFNSDIDEDYDGNPDFKSVKCISSSRFDENAANLPKKSIDNFTENQTVEYVVPIRIYHFDDVFKEFPIVFWEYDHSKTNYKGYRFYNLHKYIINDTEHKADVQINSFEKHNDLKNVVKDINFVAFSNSHNLSRKCIELKITTIKSLNKIMFPITSQYLFNNLIIVSVKFVVNGAIGESNYNDDTGCDNADLRIKINFGKITS
ncbi:bromodomain-containing protein [Cryptosporidium ryanae]|uniref:bromodomain-containing protein n=1 Tax=Cryptosporidium ryanae TaxID=515981 RepID=UPI00351A475E|nr:bromodomain-containing protein [Cryptosporidium ryanae]